MNHVKRSGEWSLLKLSDGMIQSELKERKVELGKSGTIVIWDELFEVEENYNDYQSVTSAENYILRLKERLALHLGMVFHRFIEGKVEHYPQLDIQLNGDSIRPGTPSSAPRPPRNRPTSPTKSMSSASGAAPTPSRWMVCSAP